MSGLEDRLANGREIKDILPVKEIAFAFIKPKFIGQLEQIEDILKQNGLEVIHADKLRLAPEAVDFIYRDQQDKHYFQVMKDYLSTNDSVMLMVAGKGGETQKILSGLKKMPDGKPGIIRERFQDRPFISEEEKAGWDKGEHEDQDEMTILLTQSNVIHTADSADEALESLKIIFGDKFQEMKDKGNLPAELWEIFE